MTARILVLFFLITSLVGSVWAQGGSCTQHNTWSLNTFAGNGSGPVFWPDSDSNRVMEQDQSLYGGAGPTWRVANIFASIPPILMHC